MDVRGVRDCALLQRCDPPANGFFESAITHSSRCAVFLILIALRGTACNFDLQVIYHGLNLYCSCLGHIKALNPRNSTCAILESLIAFEH